MKDAVLLVGNGVNQAFEKKNKSFFATKVTWDFVGMSWKEMIQQIAFNCGLNVQYEDISRLPSPMQIVAATKDNVDQAMTALAENMSTELISEEQKKFCEKLLNLPIEHIISTNYSYELEQAAGVSPTKNAYYRVRSHTKEVSQKEKDSRLYTYSDLKATSKKIWHIHGDAASPKTVVMGHYWYGKLLKNVQERAAKLIKIERSSNGKNRKHLQLSWVDMFLQKDVYVLGFGFYTDEIDLWWLAGCKKRQFPNSKIHFYEPKERDKGFLALMEAYGIEVHADIKVKNGNYVAYYEEVIKDIEKRLKGGIIK